MANPIAQGLSNLAFQTRRELIRTWRAIQVWLVTRFGPRLLEWWGNPLLHHARLQKPFPFKLIWKIMAIAATILVLVTVAAWIITERIVGAILLAFPLGVVLLTLLLAPINSVISTAGHFKQKSEGPREMVTADPIELVWGMALVALWRLRWLIVICLAVTPALMVSVLHLDVSTFSNYRDSVIALGSAAPPDQVQLLGPDSAIPFVRLIMRAISIGLLTYILLPLLTTLGVSVTLALRDRTLSQTLGLVASGVVLLAAGGFMQFLTTTYLLGKWLEVFRLVLVGGFFIGIGVITWRLNILNAELLVNIPADEGII